MKYITHFTNWLPLNENTAVAKQYVAKRAAQKLRKDPTALTDVERAEALETPEVQQIFELTKSYPNYTLPFLRFYFEHRAPISSPADNPDAPSLEYLMRIITQKKHLISQLEHNFDYYASLETKNRITGFERLTDEIRTIERSKEAKWFVDRLPRALRDQYRALPKDQQNRTVLLAIELKALGDAVIGRLFEKIKAFSSWKIGDVIDYVSNYVKGYSNAKMTKKIAELEALEPEASIIYLDEQYLVMSVRTEKAQKELCSIANWCINRGAFEGYAKNAVQINIFDFGTVTDDPLFLTGTTIYSSGKVRTSHDINDTYIKKSDDPVTNFIKIGYPMKLANAVMQQFPTEVVIKTVVHDLSLDTITPKEALDRVVKSSYSLDPSTDPAALESLVRIINDRVKSSLNEEEIIAFYSKYGVLSKFSAMVLKSLLPDLSAADSQSILTATVNNFKRIRAASKMLSAATLTKSITNTLAQEEEILRELEQIVTPR